MLTDTHSHIYAEEFDADRAEVVARALAAGVTTILLPAIDKESYQHQEELAASNPRLFRQMMGLHPTSVGDSWEQDLEIARELLFGAPDKYVGVGEVGLDFYWDTTYRSQQEEALRRQMDWAQELNKPLALHVRNGKEEGCDAYSVVLDMIESHHGALRGVLHCFSGSADDARRAVDAGFMLGIGGVVTYKKSTLPDIVATIPLEHLLLETDAPYLAPVPHRGRRNESAYVAIVAHKVAEIKNVSFDTVANSTSENAKRLFCIF